MLRRWCCCRDLVSNRGRPGGRVIVRWPAFPGFDYTPQVKRMTAPHGESWVSGGWAEERTE